MRLLLAIALIVVGGAAILPATRGGGSSGAAGKPAGAARERAAFGSGGARTRGGDPGPARASSRPPGGPKAPSAGAPRRDVPAAQEELTREQFIRRADAICGDAHDQVGGIGRRLLKVGVAAAKGRVPANTYYARSARLTVASERIAGRAIDDLNALPGPTDRRIGAYLAISSTQARLLGDQATALRRHDPRTVQELNLRLVKLSRRSRKLAESYGFHVCGGANG